MRRKRKRVQVINFEVSHKDHISNSIISNLIQSHLLDDNIGYYHFGNKSSEKKKNLSYVVDFDRSDLIPDVTMILRK